MTASIGFQDLVLSLMEFWGKRGALLSQPYDVEMGAGEPGQLDVPGDAG